MIHPYASFASAFDSTTVSYFDIFHLARLCTYLCLPLFKLFKLFVAQYAVTIIEIGSRCRNSLL